MDYPDAHRNLLQPAPSITLAASRWNSESARESAAESQKSTRAHSVYLAGRSPAAPPTYCSTEALPRFSCSVLYVNYGAPGREPITGPHKRGTRHAPLA